METKASDEQVLLTHEQHAFVLREWVPRLMAVNAELSAVAAYARAAREYRTLMVGLGVLDRSPAENGGPAVWVSDIEQLLVDKVTQNVFIRRGRAPSAGGTDGTAGALPDFLPNTQALKKSQ